ncbi:MAG: TonB-dependent receptor [Phascolarctobacterium sp.]|nr:TonB-dependent receptor [Phascolarctobacterium sp.]
MKKMTKAMLMTALILGSVQWGGTAVHASETTLQEFTLDPMIVTASRMEKMDLDTAAAVEVIDNERIEKSGAGNAFEVLRGALGIFASSQGPNGVALGSMTSKIDIRGVDKGTLVMLDGMPLNQDGKYNLEDIPTDIIEKIEIVRGGGAVLYGSEATGGVVNIITKNKVRNSIKVSAGNYGRERYSVNVGNEKFSLLTHLDNRGEMSPMTTVVNKTMGKTKYQQYYNYSKGENKGLLFNYNVNDNLKFTYNYSKTNNTVDVMDNRYLKSPYQSKEYEDHNNNFIVRYDDQNGFIANVSYNTQERNYDQVNFKKQDGSIDKAFKYSWRKGHNTNIDIQKSWDVNKKDKFLIGATFKKEDLDVYNSPTKAMGSTPAKPERTGDYVRDVYSLYASYDWQMNDTDNLILNLRETIVRNCDGTEDNLETGVSNDSKKDDVNKFTPELQYIKKINDDSTFYAKAGKSFRLPELTKLFGGSVILASPELKPEQGTHYEVGYKFNENNRSWRLALFHYDIKDSIEAKEGTSASAGNLVYENNDAENLGIELSCNIKHNDNFDSYYGITYSNPKTRHIDDKGNVGEWVKTHNQLQFNLGLNYHYEKTTASLMANYIGERHDEGGKVRPALYTDLHFTYEPEKNHKVFLHVNNLFDRADYTTSNGPDEDTYAYYAMGRNFMLGYEYSF